MICLMENETLVQSKERFDKEQIGGKEPLSVTNCQFYFIRIRNIWH